MLNIRDLHIRRPAFELGPFSLEVAKGEYFVLLGPSGAGKTTLLEWIAGFNRARKGLLEIGGSDATHTPPQARGLGIVYQDSALFPHLSVRDNLAFPLRMNGWAPEEIHKRTHELAETLHISHRIDAHVREISGGEARRVAIGRALALERKILLLDEPLTGLDPDLRRELRFELAALHRNLGLTIVHITHHLGEAKTLANRIGVLIGGKLEQVGTPDEVFNHPSDSAVAEFLTIENFVEGAGDPSAGVIRVDKALALPAPVTASGTVRARVTGLALAATGNGAKTTLPATFRGHERAEDGTASGVVALARDGRRPLTLHIEAGSALESLAPGDPVQVDFSKARWEIY